MRLVVCGGRSIRDLDFVRDCMRRAAQLFDNGEGAVIALLHGGAKGVDLLAAQVASEWRWPTRAYLPDYEEHPPMLAPKIRNRAMVRDADCVLAIWDGMSGGTAHAIATAAALKKPLVVEMYGEQP